MYHIAKITPQPVDTGWLLWYTENMKKKTQPKEKEQNNSKLGSWLGALKYATIGSLVFCAVLGVADAFSPRVTDSLWVCFASAVGMFILLLEFYWLSALWIEKNCDGGTIAELKIALTITSGVIAGVLGPILVALVLVR